MDTITIHNIKTPTVIGIHDHEKSVTQTLLITLSFMVAAEKAAQQDMIQETVNYFSVAKAVIAFGKATRVGLLETFAERLAVQLKTQFGLTYLKITLTKTPQDMAFIGSVDLVIERFS